MVGIKSGTQRSSQENLGSNVWESQAPYLQNLYSQAESNMNRQMGNVASTQRVLNPAYTQYMQQQQSQQQPYFDPSAAYNDANYSTAPFSQQGYGQSRGGFNQYDPNAPDMYTNQTTWSPSGTDSPEVAQAKALMAQMQGQYGQASGALDAGKQYLSQGYNAMQGANPNFDQSGNYYNQAGSGFSQMANATGVDPMADVYARQTGQSFREQIMPAIGGEAAQMGGMGSSRQGIAQGLAGARASQQIQDFNAQLYNEQQNRALAANQGLAGVGQGLQGLGTARVGQGTAMGNLGSQQASLAAGYQNNAQGMAGLADMGMNLPWYALSQYAGLLGSPTVRSLGGSGSSSGRDVGISVLQG